MMQTNIKLTTIMFCSVILVALTTGCKGEKNQASSPVTTPVENPPGQPPANPPPTQPPPASPFNKTAHTPVAVINVPVDQQFTITFNHPVKVSSVFAGSGAGIDSVGLMICRNAQGAVISCGDSGVAETEYPPVSATPSGSTITIRPLGPLLNRTKYTLFATTGLSDTSDTPLSSNFRHHFESAIASGNQDGRQLTFYWEYPGWATQRRENNMDNDNNYIGKFVLMYGAKSKEDNTYIGYDRHIEVDEAPNLTGDYEGIRNFMTVFTPDVPFAPNSTSYFALKACLHNPEICSEDSNELAVDF